MDNITEIRKQALAAEKSGEFFTALNVLVDDYIEEGLDLTQIITWLQVVNSSVVTQLSLAVYETDEED